jgi:glycosyltransferase involved in cell wall biosynthesis
MNRPVAYDITRLTTRVWNRTPNGIDRVDLAFARHFLEPRGAGQSGMLYLRALGMRMLTQAGAMEVIDGIGAHLGETDDPDRDPAYQRIKTWLRDGPESSAHAPHRIANVRKRFVAGMAAWVGRHGLPLGRSPIKTLPEGAIYFNVSQYPLAIGGAFDFLMKRRDVKPVFFIHDLLPLEAPEYFRPTEYARHQRRIAAVARFGAAAIVSTNIVKNALHGRLVRLGASAMPIHVAPPPVAPVFTQRESHDSELSDHNYFLMCGTLEPRKNHLMILNVWREMANRLGESAPKLILIGARGWENENIIDLLERSRPLRGHVLEVAGLTTPAFKRLLKGARALLMPSFAEGYGLPIAEALAVGAPVVASDIPVFREIAGQRFLSLSAIDGEGWLRTIVSIANGDALGLATANAGGQTAQSLEAYFGGIEDFLRTI